MISNLQIKIKITFMNLKVSNLQNHAKDSKKCEFITWQTNKIRSALENVHIEEKSAHVLDTVLNV
jgi:hypothetical protein